MQVGLKNIHIAIITEDPVTKEITYGTPIKIFPAKSVDLSVNAAEGNLYGDDALQETTKEFVSATLKMGITDLSPENQMLLFNKVTDAEGRLWSGAEEAPYLAVGFESAKGKGINKYVWLLKGKFGAPTETYKTKEESIEYQTPEVEGKFMKAGNDMWKVEVEAEATADIAKAWYTEVPTYTAIV